MIEYTVKDYLDFFFMTCCHEIFQILVVAQTGIQLLIVCGFITMSYAFK